jgi:hypothetical protein
MHTLLRETKTVGRCHDVILNEVKDLPASEVERFFTIVQNDRMQAGAEENMGKSPSALRPAPDVGAVGPATVVMSPKP